VNVRKRAILTIASLFIIALIAVTVISQTVIISGFINLEKKETLTQADRAVEALSREILDLDTLTLNNAAWSDTYDFLLDNNTAYIIDNVNDQTFIAANLKFEAFVDCSGQVKHLKTFDTEEMSASLFRSIILEQFPNETNLWNLTSTEACTRGIIRIGDSLFFIASRPVMTNNYEGPINGVLIMGREISSETVISLEDQTHLEIEISPLFEAVLGLKNNRVDNLQFDFAEIKVQNNSIITGETILKDINKNPAAALTVFLPRNIYDQGMATLQMFEMIIIFSFFAFGVVTILFLEKTLISRVGSLTNQVQDIISKGKLDSKRIPLERTRWGSSDDEISILSLTINSMLDKIQDSTTQLNRSERLSAIGQLAVMVAHDLRNPLQGIIIAADFLSGDNRDNHERKMRMVQLIKNGVKYCEKIITDLLDFSRERKIILSETNLQNLAIDSFSRITAPENVKINNLLSEEPKISIDALMMQRVFDNMIKNGIEAMPNGGTLTIKNEKLGGFINIIFEDTGVGVKDEDKEKLFVPLFTTKAKGMGFGLAICKRIVEAHNGTIKVDSNIGKGTRFTIRIPLNP
jgi:signal transduction histidine kinase